MSEGRDVIRDFQGWQRPTQPARNEVLLQSATFGAKTMWWLAMVPEGLSTGFTSSVMLLRRFLFLTKSVPEPQIFTKIRVALLMVNGERQVAPAPSHQRQLCEMSLPWPMLTSGSVSPCTQGATKELMNHEQQQRAAGSRSIYLPCVQLLPGACREIPAGLEMAPQTRC